MSQDLVGHRLRCPICHKIFFVCTSCFRGQRYCKESCRKEGRHRTFRRSSKSYQRSPPGRQSHRKRQKTYRKNLRLKITVTQHCCALATKPLNKASRLRRQSIRPQRHRHFVPLSCSCCGELIERVINTY